MTTRSRLRYYQHDPSGPHTVRGIIDHCVITIPSTTAGGYFGGLYWAARYALGLFFSAASGHTPGSASGNVGTTLQLALTAYDSRGNVIPGITALWSSTLPNFVSVDSSGLLSFLVGGSSTIVATVDARAYTITAQALTVGVPTTPPPVSTGYFTGNYFAGGFFSGEYFA